MLKLVSRRAARPADIQAHCGGRQLSRKIGSISDEVHFTLTRHEELEPTRRCRYRQYPPGQSDRQPHTRIFCRMIVGRQEVPGSRAAPAIDVA